MLCWKKFLGCFSLDAGVLVIGNICILLSIFSIYGLTNNNDVREFLTVNGFNSSPKPCIEFVTSLILIVVSFLLVIGTIKRHQKLIKLWLIVMAIFIFVESTIIMTAVVLPDYDILRDRNMFELFPILIFFSYSWYFVYQYDQELRHRDESHRYNVLS